MSELLTGDIMPVSFEEPEEETIEFEEAAEAIARIGKNEDWQVIKKHIEDRIVFYQDDLAGLDIKDMDLAKVGERYLVCSLVTMELGALLSKVTITTEAVDAARERRPKS